MPGFLERLLDIALLGLLPPIPNELRSDYVQASPHEQSKARLKYALRHLRWSRIVAGAIAMVALKWAWEFGLFAFLGFGGGVATAGEVGELKAQIAAGQQQIALARIDAASFKNLYQRNVLQDRIRAVDSERFQLTMAVSEANRENRAPDRYHLQRLSDLAGEREQLVAQLAELQKKATE